MPTATRRAQARLPINGRSTEEEAAVPTATEHYLSAPLRGAVEFQSIESSPSV
jgi:hypothetical protein